MKRVIVYITNLLMAFIINIKNIFSHHEKPNNVDLENLLQVVGNDLTKLISLETGQKDKINEDIKKMIPYYNHLTDQIETRRARLIESSWQTFTILIGASGFLIALNLNRIILYPTLLIFCIQIIFAVVKLVEFQSQSGFKYPFIKSKYSNKWKWFYHGNPYITSIDTNPFQKKSDYQKTMSPYLNGLHYFLENYTDEKLDKELTDNIQQLYLLQVHNFYKNKFYLRLNSYELMANRVSFIILFSFLGILLGYFIYSLIL